MTMTSDNLCGRLLLLLLLLLVPVPSVVCNGGGGSPSDDGDLSEYDYGARQPPSPSLSSSSSSSSAAAERYNSLPTGRDRNSGRDDRRSKVNTLRGDTTSTGKGSSKSPVNSYEDQLLQQQQRVHQRDEDLYRAVRVALANSNVLLSRERSKMDFKPPEEDGDVDDDEKIDDNDDADDDGNADDDDDDGGVGSSAVSNGNHNYDLMVPAARLTLLQQQEKRSALGKRLKYLNQDVRERYMRMFGPYGSAGSVGGGGNGVKIRELKRERHGSGNGVGGSGSRGVVGGGTTLSVESPMDLIRQRLMQELRRRELVEKQRQIQTNDELLSTIGKRAPFVI